MGNSISVLLLLTAMLITACGAPKHTLVTPELRMQMLQDLKQGHLTLDCESECYWSHLQAREKHIGLFISERYEELAVSVMQIGMNNDLAYFYLGYAAEKLGYMAAAERYYQRSLDLLRHGPYGRNRCDTEFFCSGINLGIELPKRLESIQMMTKLPREQSINELDGTKRLTSTSDEPRPSRQPSGFLPDPERLQVQQLLESLGYNAGKETGIDNNQFEKALRRYQRDNDLAVTGELNEATRKALGLHQDEKTEKTAKETSPNVNMTSPGQEKKSPSPTKEQRQVVVEEKPVKKESEPARSKPDDREPGSDPPPLGRGITTESTSLVSEPSVMAETTMEVPRGVVVDLLAVQGNFYKIRFNGKEGYMHANFVSKE